MNSLPSISRPKAGDGFINPGIDAEENLIIFRDSGGGDKPAYIEISVCRAETEEEGRRTAHEQWPIAANEGELNRLLPTPTHYEQVAKMVTPEDVGKHVVCGPDPEPFIRKIEESVKMGFDHACIHQIGQQQREFMEFATKEILPHFEK
jgi:hypothetical protein